MKAPDKIYVAESQKIVGDIEHNVFSEQPFLQGSIEYIRKEVLTEWLKEKIRDYWADDENTMGIYPYALEEVINKLNEM